MTTFNTTAFDAEYAFWMGCEGRGNQITSRRDIVQVVAEQFECLDANQYTLEVDDLVQIAADSLVDYLYDNGFLYGDFLPDFDSQMLFDFISDYEVNNNQQ